MGPRLTATRPEGALLGPPSGRAICSLSPPTEMSASSRNTLMETPVIMFDQIPRHLWLSQIDIKSAQTLACCGERGAKQSLNCDGTGHSEGKHRLFLCKLSWKGRMRTTGPPFLYNEM